MKLALIEATALAKPDSENEIVLDTDDSAVAISGVLYQWQGPQGERRLRPIVYRSKKLKATQAKCGAPKLEIYAAYYFILKNPSNLCARKFILRVNNQALSWLKTYSTDQALIGRWIMALEKYHFTVSIVLELSIAKPMDSVTEPTVINGEKSSSKNCHLLRTNGPSSHRRKLTNCLPCKHTKTFIQFIPRTGLTSLRRQARLLVAYACGKRPFTQNVSPR